MEEIRKIIKDFGCGSGDLMFGSSPDDSGMIVRFFTWSNWSHVGIVLEINGKIDVHYVDIKTFLWILESTYNNENLKDYIAKTSKSGVQMVRFEEKLLKYGGEMGIRHVKPKFSKHLTKKFFRFYKKYQDREFTKNKMEIIKSWYDGPFGRNKPHTKTFFCAKLVAQAFQECKMLKKDKPSNEYTQKNFERFQPDKSTKYGKKYRYSKKIIYLKKKKYIGDSINPKKIPRSSVKLPMSLAYEIASCIPIK
jgi:hypothetical protein